MPSAARLLPFLMMIAGSAASLAADPRSPSKGQLAADTLTRPVQLSKIALKLSRGQSYGSVKAGLLCLPAGRLAWKSGRHDLSLDEFDDVFKDTLSKAGFKVVGGTAELFENVDDLRAEYLVGGTIRELAVDACFPHSGLGDQQSAKGNAALTIDWSLYSRLDRKVVARVSTNGSFRRKSADMSGVGGLVLGAFEENVARLLGDGILQRTLVGAPQDMRMVRTPRPAFPPLALAMPVRAVGRLPDVVGATVLVQSGEGHGSGFLMSGEGYFLTNHHVVGGAKYVKLRWSDGMETVGEVIRVDRGRDVALLKGDSRGRAPVRLRNETAPTGLDVWAVGAPLDKALQNSVTRGIVSATRVLDGYSYVQSDVSVQHGNSGGPLVDADGDLVGITVAGHEINDAPVGLNFFIPAKEALAFLAIEPKR